MAAAEMYDYLDEVTPDYIGVTLDIQHNNMTMERGSINQVVHISDGADEVAVSLDTKPIFYVTCPYEVLNEANVGTIFDLYYDPVKANARGNSFQWDHPTDGHTYTVKFAMDLDREVRLNKLSFGLGSVVLKVLGYVADA